MARRSRKNESLTVAPNTLLGGLLGVSGSSRRKRSVAQDLLLSQDSPLLGETLSRMWNDRVGGLVLYALGVRSTPESESPADDKPRTSRRRSSSK